MIGLKSFLAGPGGTCAPYPPDDGRELGIDCLSICQQIRDSVLVCLGVLSPHLGFLIE